MSNPIKNKSEWLHQRQLAKENPGHFHGEIAKKEIHWFFKENQSWGLHTGKHWKGYSHRDGSFQEQLEIPSTAVPWSRDLDESEAPYYQWFSGAQTNAGFNEVDVHVLAGHGNETAFIFESEEWIGDEKSGHPQLIQHVSRTELFLEVAKCSLILKQFQLNKGDRIVFYMPNCLEQIYFIEAAKRLGVIYTCVFGGLSAKTLAERIVDTEAKVVITNDHFLKNGQVFHAKTELVDVALNDFISVQKACQLFLDFSGTCQFSKEEKKSFEKLLSQRWQEEIVVNRTEFIKETQDFLVAQNFQGLKLWPQTTKPLFDLLNQNQRLGTEALLVVEKNRETQLFCPSQGEYLYQQCAQAAQNLLIDPKSSADPKTLDLSSLIKAVYKLAAPVPVASDFPLFIAYTSGSTGKPKGVVHTHGGYVAGIAHTMKVSFDVEPGRDVIYCIADPGWITGQSYMICASLVSRVTSVICEGGPLFPFPTRFASTLQRHGVTILKAGSTFLRAVAAEATSVEDLKKYALPKLKVASFCAEPVSPSIQKFGMECLTPRYINSYWATEHGGIILTHFYGNKDFHLQADAHTFALPWIFAEVRVAEEESSDGLRSTHRKASPGETGEIVITKPYPYLVRTIWGDAKNVNNPKWRGDLKRLSKTYFERWKDTCYTQGDFACQYDDESWTLHGRSDEVIKTSGHRIGTEEIESALLKDKVGNPQSPLANVIVVGAKDAVKGSVPVAFLMIHETRKLTVEDEKRFSNLVAKEKGEVAIPAAYLTVRQFPETRSGKYMRRFLKSLLNDEVLGDTSTLRNPESIQELKQVIQKWKDSQNVNPDLSVTTEAANTIEISISKESDLITQLKAAVSAAVRETLGWPSDRPIATEAQLMSLGIGSLSAVKLRNNLQKFVSKHSTKSLPMNVVFLHSSVQALVEFIAREIFPDHVAKQSGAASRNLSDEVQLNPKIRRLLGQNYLWQKPKSIFLTGATGYLGSFLLAELIAKTDAKIYCLVRSPKSKSDTSRITQAFHNQGIHCKLENRVEVVAGDLAEPRIGIDAKTYQHLVESVDTIYHAGALVNHVYPYLALKAANVDGTEEILKLASQGPIKMVHNISSIGVFLGASHAGQLIPEWSFPESMEDLMDGYCQSKWAAEKLCRIALQRGLPVANYRPGHVSWHQTTGSFNSADFVVNMIRLCLTTGKAPNLKLDLDLAPINYVVSAIVELSHQPTCVAQNYSLTNPNVISLSEVMDLLNRNGHAIQTVRLEEWLQALNHPKLQDDRFTVTFQNFYLDENGKPMGQMGEMHSPIFETTQTQSHLGNSGIECTKINAAYLAVLLEQLGFPFQQRKNA